MTLAFLKQKSLSAYFADAISEYRLVNHNQYPLRIEIHPELFAQFAKELTELSPLGLIKYGSITWHGVLIVQVSHCEYPRMYGYVGEVIFI